MKKIIKILLISFLPFCGFSQVDTIVWQQKSSLPSTPRVSCASFAIDSNYFIIGGLDTGSNWYSEVWKYNIPSDSWSRMKDFPGGPIAGAFGFSINLHGFVCLGSDSISMYNGDNQFWEYYPAVDTWQHKVNYPGVARDYPVGFIYNQYAYVGMGRGPGATDLWRYNALSDNWDSVSSLPSLYRVNQGTSVIDSFAFILGGSNFTAILNDIWRYNMKADHWDSIGIIPGGLREGAFYGTLDSTIIIGYGFVVDTIGSSPGENMAQDI